MKGRSFSALARSCSGAAIFAVAALTDWLDGYLARRRQQVTTFGQLMDPLADKLLITAALVSLVQMELAPAWMVAIILGRELGVTVLRSVAFSRGVTIPASGLGKVKMMSQVVAIPAADSRPGVSPGVLHPRSDRAVGRACVRLGLGPRTTTGISRTWGRIHR